MSLASLFACDAKSAIRRQRGAISVMAAIALSLVVTAALLAVDLGNLFQTRRHLQTVADTAALSAVNDLAVAQTIALNAANLNGFAVPGENGNRLDSVPGRYDFPGKTFISGGAAADQNALQVTVTTTLPYFFMLGSREVSATATAARSDIAGLSIGTTLINIDTQKSVLLNGLLGGLLKTSLNLSAASYQGLASTNLRLLDLVKADASIGTLEALLKLDLTVPELLNLTATALSQTDLAAVDVTVIDTVKLLALRAGSLPLKLGDLIDASLAPGNAAVDAQINLLQLITLSAQVANGKNFLNVPALGLDLGGLATLNVALSMIEPPSIAIGPPGQNSAGVWRTQAHNAQWRLKLDLVVLDALALGPEQSGLIHLPLYLEVAAGDAWLKSIECHMPRDNSIVNVGASSSLIRAYVGTVNPDAMTDRTAPASVKPAAIVNLNLLGIPLLAVNARAEVNLSGGAADLAFSGPFNGSNTQSISGLSTEGLYSRLADSLVLDVSLLSIKITLGSLVDVLRGVLEPVFKLLDSLLAPVLALLGIQLGIADVTVFSLTCGAPQLVR